MSADEKVLASTRRFCEWSGCQGRALWYAKTKFFKTPICEHHKTNGDNMFLATQNGCNEEQRKIVSETGVTYIPIF